MICTVNIYTRRPERLKATIQSVLSTATHPDQVQFVLRCDCDHEPTLKALPEILSLGDVRAIVGRPMGYGKYPVANWDMSQLAQGDWIWHFDDDATLTPESKGWDEKLAAMPKSGVVVLPEWDILGGSGYHKNSISPFMFLPNGWWKPIGLTHFSQPFDDFIFHDIQRHQHWETRYLEGISTYHLRVREDALNVEQKRF